VAEALSDRLVANHPKRGRASAVKSLAPPTCEYRQRTLAPRRHLVNGIFFQKNREVFPIDPRWNSGTVSLELTRAENAALRIWCEQSNSGLDQLRHVASVKLGFEPGTDIGDSFVRNIEVPGDAGVVLAFA
jgi:hypothetical protein